MYQHFCLFPQESGHRKLWQRSPDRQRDNSFEIKYRWQQEEFKALQLDITNGLTIDQAVTLLKQVQDKRWNKSADSPQRSTVYTAAMQTALDYLGYNEVGKIDGWYGSNTSTALYNFQSGSAKYKSFGARVDGLPGPSSTKALIHDVEAAMKGHPPTPPAPPPAPPAPPPQPKPRPTPKPNPKPAPSPTPEASPTEISELHHYADAVKSGYEHNGRTYTTDLVTSDPNLDRIEVSAPDGTIIYVLEVYKKDTVVGGTTMKAGTIMFADLDLFEEMEFTNLPDAIQELENSVQVYDATTH